MGNFQDWVEYSKKDDKLNKILKSMDQREIDLGFYSKISFNAASIRGIIGIGSNRINEYTIRLIAQAIAKTTKSYVVIGYDSRKFSKDFAVYIARVLLGNKVRIVISKDVCSVSHLAYATKKLHANLGIMVTASHNPKEYNGLKLYDKNGIQVSKSYINLLQETLDKTTLDDVKICSVADYNSKKILIKDTIFDQYIKDASDTGIELSKEEQSVFDNLQIGFSALNGVTYQYISQISQNLRLRNLYSVPQQETPDERFLTCPRPNPELVENFKLAKQLYRDACLDAIIILDPDGDRIALMQDDIPFSANELAILLANFLLEKRSIENPILYRSFVSTNLIDKMVKAKGGTVVITDPGFNNISEKLLVNAEQKKNKNFFMAFEESCGFQLGSYSFDKDAISTYSFVLQMLAYYKTKNIKLVDALKNIYDKYGYYICKNKRIECPDEQVHSFLETLKTNKIKVEEKKDITIITLNSKLNVYLRESKTEPITKVYIHVNAQSVEEANYYINKAETLIDKYLVSIFTE